MLQVARLAPNLLGDSGELIGKFLSSQLCSDGGFADRDGHSDLYYTVFGLESFLALRLAPPMASVKSYLKAFGAGEDLDFVHLTCLGRCWATVSQGDFRLFPMEAILHRIETFRSGDGGYAQNPGVDAGSVYAAFLALGVYEDFHIPAPGPSRLVESLHSLRSLDGAYSNGQGAAQGITTATAAAILALRRLGEIPGGSLADWLFARAHPEGGFFALPGAPIPDLLSTASALHALSALQVSLESIREPCLDFIDSLWTNRGGFFGNWADDRIDCEYTYYALLGLGHLAL